MTKINHDDDLVRDSRKTFLPKQAIVLEDEVETANINVSSFLRVHLGKEEEEKDDNSRKT